VVCHWLLRRMVWLFVPPLCRLAHALLTSAAAVSTSLLQAATVIDRDCSRVSGSKRTLAAHMRRSLQWLQLQTTLVTMVDAGQPCRPRRYQLLSPVCGACGGESGVAVIIAL
jgi:hypothetical protein